MELPLIWEHLLMIHVQALSSIAQDKLRQHTVTAAVTVQKKPKVCGCSKAKKCCEDKDNNNYDGYYQDNNYQDNNYQDNNYAGNYYGDNDTGGNDKVDYGY